MIIVPNAFVTPFVWPTNLINPVCNNRKIMFKIKKIHQVNLFGKRIIAANVNIINPRIGIPINTFK